MIYPDFKVRPGTGQGNGELEARMVDIVPEEMNWQHQGARAIPQG